MFSRLEDRIPVKAIKFGIYRFTSSEDGAGGGLEADARKSRQLYLRVDGGNNQCLLLGLNHDKAGKMDPTGDPVDVEEVPFDQIKKIM